MPAWASDWLRILTFLCLIALIWYSRRWTAPKQDAELRAVEDDVRGVRADLRRVERDVYSFRKEFVDINERVLKELQALSQNGAREEPIEHQLNDLKEAVFELERTIAAMPCAHHVQNNLGPFPPKEE